MVLLDTDVWSALFVDARGRDARATGWRELLVGRRVAIATQTRAESLAGAHDAGWGDRRLGALRMQLDATATVPVTWEVVDRYAELTASLRRSGHGLHQAKHTGDRWIAATALAIGAELLSGDGIYRGVPRLALLGG